MQLMVLCILSESPSWLKEIQETYTKKIKPFGAFEVKEIKPKKHGRDQADFKKSAESQLLLAQIKDQDFVILLDEKGKDLDSIEFSKKLGRWQNSGKKRVIFVIGGAYGVSDEISAYKAQYSWNGQLPFLDTDLNPTAAQILAAVQQHQNPLRNNITNINQIDANWVNKLVDPGFKLIYPPRNANGNLIIPLDVWNKN